MRDKSNNTQTNSAASTISRFETLFQPALHSPTVHHLHFLKWVGNVVAVARRWAAAHAASKPHARWYVGRA